MKMANLHPASFFSSALHSRRGARDENGFTLIEIVLAFFILAIMALAALPLMATGLRLSAESTVVTAANQRVQQTIETARVAPVSCSSLNAKVGNSTFDDGRGNTFRITVSLPSGCSTSVTTAQSIPVLVTATRVRDNKLLTSAITKIFIPGTTTT